MEKLTIIVFSIFILLGNTINAQEDNHELAFDYITKYKDFAIEEMHRTGIPASITLAQGMLESDYGRSRLAVLANNHFGAKCHKNWYGPSIKHTDDAPDECFRKYGSVRDSYQNHSKILEKKRYVFLFHLRKTDYKAWCHGLKKAGYATDPYYGYKLIRIIERYSLNFYDKIDNVYNKEYASTTQSVLPPTPPVSIRVATIESPVQVRQVSTPVLYDINNMPKAPSVKYGKLHREIIRKTNKTRFLSYKQAVYPVQISEMYNLPLQELLTLNGWTDNSIIPENTIVFLEEREDKAEKMHKYHKVMVGENLSDIARKYAINVQGLSNWNKIPSGQEPVPGQILSLRKYTKNTIKTYTPNPKRRIAPQHRDNGAKTFLVESKEEFRPIASPQRANAVNKKASTLEINNEVKRPIMAEAKTVIKKPSFNFENTFETEIQTKPTILAYVPQPKRRIVSRQPIPRAVKVIPIKKDVAKYHTVKAGQTLYRISIWYDTSVAQLKELNYLSSNTIVIGSSIRVR